MPFDIFFTTLAIGKEYNGYAQRLFLTLQKMFKCKLLIVTDDIDYFHEIKSDNLILVKFPEHLSTKGYWMGIRSSFNYNLKYLCFKHAAQHPSDIICYLDCDWFVNYTTNIKKFNEHINHIMQDGQLDGIAGRSSRVKHEKENRTFLPERKIEFYKLRETEEYDEVQIVNEQYILLKNNEKVQKFAESWERLEKYCTEEKGVSYAEGLEIGMAAQEAGINFHILNTLGDVFFFFSNKSLTYYGV